MRLRHDITLRDGDADYYFAIIYATAATILLMLRAARVAAAVVIDRALLLMIDCCRHYVDSAPLIDAMSVMILRVTRICLLMPPLRDRFFMLLMLMPCYAIFHAFIDAAAFADAIYAHFRHAFHAARCLPLLMLIFAVCLRSFFFRLYCHATCRHGRYEMLTLLMGYHSPVTAPLILMPLRHVTPPPCRC